MYRIKKITLDDVKACKFKPEPHTVSLKDNGEWYAVEKDKEIISVLCVSDKHGGKYLSENYTKPEFRGKGVFTMLLNFIVNTLYKNDLIIAHCLKASVNCYKRVGFTHYNTREFKYGTQYYMRREAFENGKEDGKTANSNRSRTV